LHNAEPRRPLTLRAVLAYGSLLFGVLSVANAFELVVTRGVCWVYVFGFFITVVVVHGVLRTGRFGMGIAMFVFYATVGTFMEYWMDYVVTPALIAPWAAVVWGLAGPFAGLSADLAHRFLPRTLAEGGRAAATGAAFVGALFVLVLLALSVSYLDPAPGLAHYLNGIGFTLPWLLVTGGFAGYVAHALRRAAGGARAEGPAHAGASPPYQG